jgi:ubiquinone/menaquinone biosynthesis C-methylase UbiE
MKELTNNRIELERKFWNSKAQSYDKVVSKFLPKFYETILVNLIQDVSQSKKVLDAAAGTGILSIEMSEHVSHITAIDIAPEMLNVAKEKSARMQKYNIDFEVGDICNLKFDNKSFDTVVASNVLHLLFNPEIALQEIRRVLTDQGKIITATGCYGANLRTKILSRIFALLGQKARSRWSQKSLKEFIEKNGFAITKEVYMNGMIPLVYLVAIKK